MTLKTRRRDISAIAAAVGLLIALCAPSSAQVPPKAASSSDAARVLAEAESWGYQLQRINPESLAAIPYDVFVIDYSRDGTDEKALTAAEVAALKRKPDGSRRIVLAYLSIGEAENYRYYWQADWETPGLAPPWLAGPNKRWRTNFPVRYWDPDWQAIVFTGEASYLSRIAAAGFDGVYLDRVDAFEEFENENPAARAQMITFVNSLAAHARVLKPGFLVVPQNAEELLDDAGYRAMIDGIAKEDLLFGDGRPKRPNKPARTADSLEHLNRLRPDRKPVFVVEYIDDPEDVALARKRIEELGFVPHFADRKLDTMRPADLPPAKK